MLAIPVRCRGCGTAERNRNTFGKHRGVGAFSRTFYNHFKFTAKRRSLDFTVTIEYLSDLFESQGRKCALSGLPLEMPVGTGVGGALTTPNSPSLDRIDSTKGYVEGNVQWLNKYANIMKNDLSNTQFIAFCHTVSERHKKPDEPLALDSVKWSGGRKKSARR